MRRVGAACGLVLLGTISGIVPGVTGSALAKARPGATLPTGWEMCVLQGVKAPFTAENADNLDTWQIAEGGSTNNDVAFNPFNTMRGTDVNDTPLPATYDAQGFPMFDTWAAGCAATVATLLQPNMAPIVSALVAGNLAPPAAFLATVDQTPWCAPSDGTPCYMDLITGHVAVTTSAASGLFHDANDVLSTYDKELAAQGALEQKLAGQRQQLQTAELEVALAQLAAQHATDVLRTVAVQDYTSNPSLDHMAALLSTFHPPNQTDLLTQYYRGLDVSAEVGRFARAKAGVVSAEAAKSMASAAVQSTVPQLDAARHDATRTLARLDIQLVALQTAGVCGPPPAPGPPAPGAPAATPAPAPAAAAAAGGGNPGDLPTVATLRTCLTALVA